MTKPKKANFSTWNEANEKTSLHERETYPNIDELIEEEKESK